LHQLGGFKHAKQKSPYIVMVEAKRGRKCWR